MKFSKIISFSQMLVPDSLVVIVGIFRVVMAILTIGWEVKRLVTRNTESFLPLILLFRDDVAIKSSL